MTSAARSSRPVPSRWTGFERKLRAQYGDCLAGMDEVGRGPLAGPVVACAVIMPATERAIRGVDDSKRLTPAAREKLAVRIRERALNLALGAASAREVDRYNIYHATTLAMKRALRSLGASPNHVVLDGRPIRDLGVAHSAVVGGDGRCYSVACASIVAKVTRDRLMKRLAQRYPQYGWDHNVGYATALHMAAIDEHGASPHHRASFCIRQLSFEFGDVLTDPD